MYEVFVAPFVEFEFMRRALVGSLVLALSAAPVGVFLTLRRMSLVGDAMAHAILPGVAVAFLIAGFSVWWMTLGGLAAGLGVAFLSGLTARVTVLREDATLAAFYLVSLATGVILVSARGSNVDLIHFLFGNVLALDDDALILAATIATITLVTLAVVFRPLVMDTVDTGFLKSVSRVGGPAYFAFMALVVMNLVGAFQAIGTLLGVGLMILPAVSARFWTADVSVLVILAVVFGVLMTSGGLLASYHLDRETGPTMILAGGALLLVSLVFGRAGGLVPRLVRRRHLES